MAHPRGMVIARYSPPAGGFFVRPARMHAWRCNSSHKLATANEVKRNCGRAAERGEEAWRIIRERMDKTG